MGAREFDPAGIRADRIWAHIEALPLPDCEADRSVARTHIMDAIIEELGCRHIMLMWQLPKEITESAAMFTIQRDVRMIAQDRISGKPIVVADDANMSRSMVEQAIEHWAAQDKTTLENIDTWSSYIMHGDHSVGMVTLCRYRSRGGPVTSADRDVIAHLGRRLGALLHRWSEVRVDDAVNR